jgi:NAD(P)-dependent dehydrogenase (short-subunit alcohol dehydrogenase family)
MSRSPVVLVTGALIGIGRAIAIRYGRAWARAGSWRLLGDVGVAIAESAPMASPISMRANSSTAAFGVIAACMATAPAEANASG